MDIAIETVVEIIFWLITIGTVLLITKNTMTMRRKHDLYLIKDLKSHDTQE